MLISPNSHSSLLLTEQVVTGFQRIINNHVYGDLHPFQEQNHSRT